MDADTKENAVARTLKRPLDLTDDLSGVKKVKRRNSGEEIAIKNGLKIVDAPSVEEEVPTEPLEVATVLDDLISKISKLEADSSVTPKPEVITLSDDEKTESRTPTPSLKKEKRASVSHKKKLTEEEKIARENERLRKAEERRKKMEEAAAAKQLRLREKEEAAEKRRIEKERREREKERKEKEREEQKRMLEEKKLAEEDAKRQKDLKRKEEEERREQKRKEEEERKEQKRLEEEEKREKKRKEEEAEELRKKRMSNHFMSFFSKKQRTSQPVLYPVQGPFRPFEIKEGMVVAPILRRPRLSADQYRNLLNTSFETPYLSQLPRRVFALKSPMRAKLFQFHDNYRPPYYGTWRKRSELLNGRRPFTKDVARLDYEVDSDEEWEEEEGDADDCDKDEPADDEEKEEDCSDDEDGFFVDHGYLSDGEGDEEEGGAEEAEEDWDGSKMSKSSKTADEDALRKDRLKAKAAEWKENLDLKSTRNKKLRPTLYGPVFGRSIPCPLPAFLEPMVLF